jgi:alkanesulfonate monooxygenase SsuD/methylene tetrahydromethanopterin reductase-like flavin-dependent oxidoreductase (luciferase family)
MSRRLQLDGAPPAIGALIADTQAPTEMLPLALRAEQAGFDEIWVGEDYFLGGGIASAASILALTNVPVGLGIVPATGRHPSVLALELATLAGMFPRRLSAGLGAGVPELTERIRARADSPLGAVDDALRAVRLLLEGEMLTTECTTFFAEGVRLAHPPAHPPALYIGAGGPKMLRLSAARADGTVLSVLSGPEYVRWAYEQLLEGGARGGHRLVVYALCAIDSDPLAAREMVRESVALFALPGPRNPLSEVQGFADRAEELAAIGLRKAIPLIPDRWLDELTVAGTPSECAEKILAFRDAGADAVMLCFPPGPLTGEMIDRAGREVLPTVRDGAHELRLLSGDP